MPRTAEWIADTYQQRRLAQSPTLQMARTVAQAYNGDLAVPLPELDRNERAPIANLIQQGVDQTALRIASTPPDIDFPPIKPHIKSSRDKAQLRREATLGWWTSNRINLKLRRRARWLITFTSAPVLIRPSARLQMPVWRPMSPLNTFPAQTADPDEIAPPDCIFAYRRSVSWLIANHGRETAMKLRLNGERAIDNAPDTQLDIIEYVDHEQFSLVAVGSHADDFDPPEIQALMAAVMLDTVPNRAGVCTAVVPSRISLDRPVGQFDGAVGLYQNAAAMTALHIHATRKGVFPEMWLVSRPNESAQIVKMANPQTGEMGEIAGADLERVQVDPTFQSSMVTDRLVESMRVGSGTPAEFGGQAASNVRTGRRAEQLMSSVVDFPVQEAQEILAASLQAENQRAIAIDKAYWGSTKKSFVMTWKRNTVRGDYTPNEVFEDDVHSVTFPMAGADANGFIIRSGQKMQLGAMSTRTFLELDPETDDANKEMDRVHYERFLEGVLVEYEQPGSLPLSVKARLAKRVLEDEADPFQAVLDAQEELQQEQAAAAGPNAAPEQQPGLAPADAPQITPQSQPSSLASVVARLNL